jgi:hypothetical protein
MSLQESYGFDAFCQELIQTWPTISLSFRRVGNRLFVTASSLDVLATAVSHNDELAGSTVRRAVADLHTRLVVRGPLAALKPVEARVGNAVEEAVLALVQEMQRLNGEIEILEDHAEGLAEALSDYLESGDPELLDNAVKAGKELPEIPAKLNALRVALEEAEAKLIELDPDNEIESALADSGRL